MLFANVEPIALDLQLPWQENPDQEEKFRELLKRILIALLVFALIVPWLPVFEPEYTALEQTDTTQLVLEPVVVEPEPEPVQPPPPTPRPPEPKPQAEPEPRPAVERTVEAPPPPPPKDKESVREEQGLTQLSSQLSALRGSVNVERLQRKNVNKSELGKVEHSTRDAFGEEIAAKRSQGIQVDDALLQQESISLAAYSGKAVQVAAYSDQPGGSALSYLSGQEGRRDMENIRRTFEAAKSRVYSLYLQSLHEHPELAGKFIFRLVIEPDGSISELELVTSELGVRDLEVAILDRIRHINFGAKEVSATAVEYAFSFLPS
ncbi:MAG: AgmX/PglI C-terminal domain-containing protein [Cellvibrionaceae bacterium]